MRAYTALFGTLALVGGLVLSPTTVHGQSTWYVDCAASGAGTGGTWTDAFTSLQEALAAASGGDEIWVAACSMSPGAYRPNQGASPPPDPRDATFVLINGVAIYGGFPPGGGSWQDRAPATYETILSGDLAGDDVVYSSCCIARPGETGCDDPACETNVCAQEPDCCNVEWDQGCADLAATLCPGLCVVGDNSENSYHVSSAPAMTPARSLTDSPSPAGLPTAPSHPATAGRGCTSPAALPL